MSTFNANTSIRAIIQDICSTISPFDSTEEEHLKFVNQWISSGAELFRTAKPDKPNIHLVSYFIIVDPKTHEFLLVDHKKAQLWLPPGGHVEPNEHPKETVKREAKEELDIDATFIFDNPVFLTVTNTVGNVARHTDVSLWYILKGDRQNLLTFDADEFHQIQWFHHDHIPYERTDPHLKRFIDKITKKLTI